MDLQHKIVAAVNECSGHAFKCSNRFLIGVPDISMITPGSPHVYNEVKKVTWPKKSATVPFEATPKQRSFLKKYRKAGGISIYTVFGHDGKQWRIHIGHDLTLKSLPVITFDVCPPWTQPKLLVAKFEAYIAGMK